MEISNIPRTVFAEQNYALLVASLLRQMTEKAQD